MSNTNKVQELTTEEFHQRIVDAQAPVATVYMLSDAQAIAINKMDKSKELDSITKSVVSSRIKSMYKGYADGAEKDLSNIYDQASKRGAKFELEKHVWIAQEMKEVRELLNKL